MDEYVKLAKYSVENFVKNRKMAKLYDTIPDELISKKAGVFVSLKMNGNLRGCIGTIGPTKKNIAEEILENSVTAAVGDLRFDPVREEELEQLVYSVDVLSEPEWIQSKDLLDPNIYGVIVTTGFKRGLLLPNLEGIDSVDEQISIALRKAGIKSDEEYKMERFKVVRHTWN